MSRTKKNRQAKQPTQILWKFDPDIPTHDFFDFGPLDDAGNLQEAVDGFVSMLEKGDFLTWEAVVCEEQGLPLTAQQTRILGDLIGFGDEANDQTLYFNEIARTSEPWHVILNKIVPHLLLEPFRTFGEFEDAQLDGWHRITAALDEHGQGLSLPPGLLSQKEVVPADLRHKLSLQSCFGILAGLGQADDLHLEEDDPWRVDVFNKRLRECKESVARFGLTLDSLLTRVILPERDQPLFITLMQARLGLGSAQEQIADHL